MTYKIIKYFLWWVCKWVDFFRFSYISQKSLSFMCPIRVRHKRDYYGRLGGQKWSSSHFVAWIHWAFCWLTSLALGSSWVWNYSTFPWILLWLLWLLVLVCEFSFVMKLSWSLQDSNSIKVKGNKNWHRFQPIPGDTSSCLWVCLFVFLSYFTSMSILPSWFSALWTSSSSTSCEGNSLTENS